MRIHVFETQSGEAHIDLDKIVAVVRHIPHRDNFNVDLHMESGTIFTVSDCDVPDFMMILDYWAKGDEE
jgi:hypothetical protein